MKILHYRTGPLSVNTYIVYDEESKKGFIVDPGGSFKRLTAETALHGITLQAVLLTHGHFDHAGAAKNFQDLGIKVYIHEKDAELLYTDKNLASSMGVQFEQLHADVLLKDAQILALADTAVKVLHTPGHSPGSVCLVAEDKIFSGDTLFHLSVGRTDFLGGDSNALKDSIQNKLFVLQSEYDVYPGHEGFTTLSYEKLYNPILEYGE